MIGFLSKFLAWWIGQLSDALPTLSTVRKRAAIVAELNDQFLSLHEREIPHTDLGKLHLSITRANHQTLPSKPLPVGNLNRRVVLRLPESAGVRRLLSLPTAAEPHLQAIAANELDRLTPWRPEQAIFSVTVLASSPEGGLDVEITAIPRFAFTAAADCLRGVKLDLIGILLEHPARTPDFVAIERDMGSAAAAHRRSAALGASMAAMALLVLMIAFGVKLWAIHDLEAHMLRLEADAKKVQVMQADLRKLSERTYYAVEIKRKTPTAIVTLEVLSRLLPDDCWLDSLTMVGDQVTLEGHATDALALLPLLTTSGFFTDVHFDSEVMRDIEAEIERFSLTATVVPHAAP